MFCLISRKFTRATQEIGYTTMTLSRCKKTYKKKNPRRKGKKRKKKKNKC